VEPRLGAALQFVGESRALLEVPGAAEPQPGEQLLVRLQSALVSHTNGMNTLLLDGSVRFLTGSVSPNTWWAACTPAGGETLGNDW